MGESPQSEEPPPRYEDIVDDHQELPSGNETSLMDEGEDEVGVVKEEEEPEEMVCYINSFYYQFLSLFIHSSIYSSIPQSVHSFISSFIHSF